MSNSEVPFVLTNERNGGAGEVLPPAWIRRLDHFMIEQQKILATKPDAMRLAKFRNEFLDARCKAAWRVGPGWRRFQAEQEKILAARPDAAGKTFEELTILQIMEEVDQMLVKCQTESVKTFIWAAHAQLETVEQECDDEREEHERVQLRLRIALQKVIGECHLAEARLKKVEQERDRATDQYKSVIAEWARLEQAAYGAP